MKKKIAVLAGLMLMAGSSMFVGGAAAAPPAKCTGNTGPLVYTDGLNHYASVCVDGAPDGVTYVQVNDIPRALSGDGALIELGTGIGEIDTMIGSTGTPASGQGCNPDAAGPGTDNLIDLTVARLYTNGLNNYIGVCNGYGRVQIDQLDGAYTPDGLPDPPSVP